MNIWIFFGAPVTAEIAILPFVEVGTGSSYSCCLSSSGLFLFSPRVSVSPAFHELCSLCFQDTCIFFTSLLDGNPVSLPFISLAPLSMKDVFYSLSPSHPLRCAVIYHLPYTDRQVATFTKVRLGVRFVSISSSIVRSEKLCCFPNFNATSWHSKTVRQRKRGLVGQVIYSPDARPKQGEVKKGWAVILVCNNILQLIVSFDLVHDNFYQIHVCLDIYVAVHMLWWNTLF